MKAIQLVGFASVMLWAMTAVEAVKTTGRAQIEFQQLLENKMVVRWMKRS